MDQFLQQIVNGLSLGSTYALIALGYTMVYGIIKLINFAHGDIYMLGAYIGFAVITKLGLGFFPALIIAMVLCAIIGILTERIAYKPLRNSPRIALLITAIGVSFFMEYVMVYFVGANVRAFPDVIPKTQYYLGDVVINLQQIVILCTTIALMVLLQFIVHKTKIGKAMRAVSADRDAAELMGINVNRTISATFAIGSALAGAGGVMVGMFYNSINPLMGMLPGIKAFVAAVFGGIGSIPGAVIGAFIIGICENIIKALGYTTFSDAFTFALLIVILLFKPTGLFGEKISEKV